MRDIPSDDRLDQQFHELLASSDERVRMYVYRLVDDQPERPAMLNGLPFRDLLEVLRDEHGGGEFLVMFRRGDKMLLTGRIAVFGPRYHATPSL